MSTEDLPSRSELFQLPNWPALKARYRKLKFNDPVFERVEEYGVRMHKLDQRLPSLQDFWRFHVAPATLRPRDARFAPKVGQITSRMAERSYEVYCNICDALDELDSVNKQEPQPPRYRSCLNVFRCLGDAFQLFDSLVEIITRKDDGRPLPQGEPPALPKILGCAINLPQFFNDDVWRTERQNAIAYRNMLVHHGRPWLNFDGDEFVGYPYVLESRHSWRRVPGRGEVYVTWTQQVEMFRDPKHRGKFIELPKACAAACEATIAWIDRGYRQIIAELDSALGNPDRFFKYRQQWGTPA